MSHVGLTATYTAGLWNLKLLMWCRQLLVAVSSRGGGCPQHSCATDFLRDVYLPGFPQQVEKALSLIGQKFRSLSLTNVHTPPPPTPPTPHFLPTTCWVSPSFLAALMLGAKAAVGHRCRSTLDAGGWFTEALTARLGLCSSLLPGLCHCNGSD